MNGMLSLCSSHSGLSEENAPRCVECSYESNGHGRVTRSALRTYVAEKNGDMWRTKDGGREPEADAPDRTLATPTIVASRCSISHDVLHIRCYLRRATAMTVLPSSTELWLALCGVLFYRSSLKGYILIRCRSLCLAPVLQQRTLGYHTRLQ